MQLTDEEGTRGANGSNGQRWRWVLDDITGAQGMFWGPGVLPLPDFLNAPHPAPPGAFKTSQMGLSIP